MPSEVPEATISEAPHAIIAINEDWLVILDGTIGRLLSRSLWIGDDDDYDIAEDNIRTLLKFEDVAVIGFQQTLLGYGAVTPDGTGSPGGNYGTRFQLAATGKIVGIKLFMNNQSASDYRVNLYNVDGTQHLASAEAYEAVNGWIVGIFDHPVNVTIGDKVVATGFSVVGAAPYTAGFHTAARINGDIYSPADNATPGERNGLYNTNLYESFPSLTTGAIGFYPDIIFVRDE